MHRLVTCSDSTDNSDSWTEQNNCSTASAANAVTFNSVGHVFVGVAGGVDRSTNDGASWTDISSVIIRVGGNLWAHGHGFGESMPLAERVVSEYFAASHPAASASEPDTASKAHATALNHRCDCDDWLTAIDHCTRKLLRNLSETE